MATGENPRQMAIPEPGGENPDEKPSIESDNKMKPTSSNDNGDPADPSNGSSTESVGSTKRAGSGDNVAPVESHDKRKISAQDLQATTARIHEPETTKGITAASGSQSLQDVGLGDSTITNLPTLYVYLVVNGVSLSSPSVERAHVLGRPVGQSVEHRLSGCLSTNNYSFLKIKHFATGMGVFNHAIGQTQVSIRDLQDFNVKTVTDPQEKLNILHKFNSGVENPPLPVSVISFTTPTVDHNVDVLVRASLTRKTLSRNIARPQMDTLKSVIESAKSGFHFEMLVLPIGKYTRHLAALEKSVSRNCELEKSYGPLEFFFRANDQSMKLHTLHVSQIPDFGKGDIPDMPTQPPFTRYVNESQRVVMQLVGAACEFRAQEQAYNALKFEKFEVATIPCKHTDGEPQCIIIAMTGNRGHLLPRNGDPCLVRLPTKRRETATGGEGNPVSAATDDNGDWCSAQRLDIEALRKRSDWQVYLVKASKTMRSENLDFEYVNRSDIDMTQDAYISLITSDRNLKKAQFKQVTSDKPIKAMAHALNSLKHHPAAPTPISDSSKNAANYLLRFEKLHSVDVFEKLPNLDRVRKNLAPMFVMDAFKMMDESKRGAFRDLNDTPDGMAIIPGVAACGKSTFLMFIILVLYFAACQSDTTPQEAEAAKAKVLYCVNNNYALDTFAMNLQSMFDKSQLGPNAPDILRIYGLDNEVIHMLQRVQKPKSTFNRDAAMNETGPESHQVDRFLALLEISIHDEQSSIRKTKDACRNMSLEQGALKHHEKHPDENKELEDIIQKMRLGTELTREGFISLKDAVKRLYHNFLAAFDGIICCTPISASSFQLRSLFKPDIVLVDEGGRLPELELLILVAWYSGPWLVVGDKYQLSPFVRMDPSAQNPAQSRNPFVRQIAYSTLARATDAGATSSYLRFNHRSLGDLAAAPSAIIYRDFMDVPAMKPRDRYSPSVRSLQQILRQTHPTLKPNTCTLLVSMPGSWVGVAGTSSYNVGHVRWALQQVVKVLHEDEAMSASGDGTRATVLVMPFYRAQLEKYLDVFRQLVRDGTVSQADEKRVKFATPDSSQGDQADFVVVDMVNTDHLGFTGDERRLCLTLTRARQAQIILANRGTFIGMEKSSQHAERSAVIRGLYTYYEAIGSVASVPVCVYCEMPTPGHESEDCPLRRSDATFVKCRALYCDPKLHDKHNSKDCPRVSCRNCRRQGHRTNECPEPTPCANCLKGGHGLDQCPRPDSCHFCGDMSHRTWECETTCKLCLSKDHGETDCPAQKCSHCGYNGHNADHCDSTRPQKETGSVTCRNCGETGHIRKDCPTRPARKCHNCGETSHIRKDCPTRPARKCHNCGESGHIRANCEKTPAAEQDGDGGLKPPAIQCSDCGGPHRKRDCGGFQKMETIAPIYVEDNSDRAKIIMAALAAFDMSDEDAPADGSTSNEGYSADGWISN